MDSKVQMRAIQRIYKDLKEIEESPIDGLSIVIPDENDPFFLRANILILDGIYKDLLLHLIVELPKNYPIKAPKINIAPGQYFDHRFHHHVFSDRQKGGYTICIDLLDHNFFGEGQQTGWTPAYTLTTVLMQMQIFFAKDHDLGPHVPSKKEIEELKEMSKKFQTTINLTNGKQAIHSFDHPFPPLQSPNKTEPKKEDPQEALKQSRAYSRLTCYLTRNTPKDSDSPMGYPILITHDQKNRIEFVPIPEILCYEGYVMQLASSPQKVFDAKMFGAYFLRTAMGAKYNYWFPLYTNEKSFIQNKQHILNAISVLVHGIEGLKQFDFKPEMILQVFPCLMNKMIVSLQKGALFQSFAAIEAYCHFMRLFARLLLEYPEIQSFIDKKAEDAALFNKARNKENLGDMGEFLITLAFSKVPFQDKNLWKELIKEYISRQFLWVILKVDAAEKSDRNFEKFSMNPSLQFEERDVFLKERKEIVKSNILFFYQMNGHEMKEFYRGSKISNNLLLFNFMAARRFLLDKKEFCAKIDANYGVVEETQVEEFLKEIKTVKTSINNYEDLLKTIGLGDIYNDYMSILGLFREALKNSYVQGYNSFKINKMSNNFLQKSDYISLLFRWFLEADEKHKKLIDCLISPEKNGLIINIALKETFDVFAEEDDFPFPKDFESCIKNRLRGFEIEILNKRFFYFFLLLLSRNLNNVPKHLLLEIFTLSPKPPKNSDAAHENQPKNPPKKVQHLEEFTGKHIEDIFRCFSIVFNMTINRLFEKFKVLTLQSLCFLIRVFLLAKQAIPQLNEFLEKTVSSAFASKDHIQFGSLVNLAFFLRLSNHDSKDFETKMQFILKNALSRNIAKQIRMEQQKPGRPKNIIEILNHLFKEQFELHRNEDFQKILFIQKLFHNIFREMNEFVAIMDQNYFILSDEKAKEMREIHKKVKEKCENIDQLGGFFSKTVDSDIFLFDSLELALKKTRFFTRIDKDFGKLMENHKSCLFFAKLYWNTSIFQDLKVKGFEEVLIDHLFGVFNSGLYKIFSGYFKKAEEKEKELEKITEVLHFFKSNIGKYKEKNLKKCARFLEEECVDECSQIDFERFLIVSWLLGKKAHLISCFGRDIFRKYLRMIIASVWSERFVENSGEITKINYQRFFDPFWLKQTVFDNDLNYKKKHKYLIFLIGLEDELRPEILGEKFNEFHSNEKGAYLQNVFEHLGGKKQKNERIKDMEKMIKEIQDEIKDQFQKLIE